MSSRTQGIGIVRLVIGLALVWARPSLAQKRETSECLRFELKDLPSEAKDPNGPSEIDEAARGRGFNYAKETRRAAGGDAKALKRFFELAQNADGAAAESISGVPTVVYHLLGDEKFARFLAGQPVTFRILVRNRILSDGLPAPASGYLSRHFPRTSALLFQREMVDWPSPDNLYVIRKVFPDALELAGSTVERAELIEKKSGRVLCDLTADDIGTGAQREGEALWSSDSKRVACLSTDLTGQEGDMFGASPPSPARKRTAVYQRADDGFVRVDLSLGSPPDRAKDEELRGAVTGHEYTEPLRWTKPNVLLLRRHEYFRKKMPMTVGGSTFETIHDLARAYEITATIVSDGRARVVWKRTDRE